MRVVHPDHPLIAKEIITLPTMVTAPAPITSCSKRLGFILFLAAFSRAQRP